MMVELRLAKLELNSSGLAYEPPKMPERNLGGAIFLVAIEDYCNPDEEIHATAKKFLYPTRANWQDHFFWAVSLVEGLNPAWLRDALDRSRSTWDRQRAARKARRPLRHKLRMKRTANERKTSVEREQAAVVVRGDRVAV
jgi:hypothetical protein